MNLIKETMQLKNWAVVGATTKENRFGYKIVKKLKENDYNVFPVNPKITKVAGLKCYDDLNSIKEKIDVVDMVVNPDLALKVMAEINELGIKYVWLQPGTRSQKIRDFAAENDIQLVEDCIYANL